MSAIGSCRFPRTPPTAPAPRFVIARRPQADVAISGRQLRFRRKYPIIRPSTARFPRRFAPRNDKPEGPAPLIQWRKYCCSPRRSGNTATFFSRAAAPPPGLFPFTALHIIENYGIFSVKILTKKLRGDMLDLPRKEGSPRNERFCRHRK